jgi:deazaflavin-dependent oxidoreductase (nitroreductase family)
MDHTTAPRDTHRTGGDDRYLAPGRMDAVFNGLVRRLTNVGISVAGSRELRIVGRKSGQVRKNVVNPLSLDGERYLVAPRGVTAWVRNLRAAGRGELRVGRRHEPFTATEMADADKVPVLRAYLDKWGWEVGRFFPGITEDSSDDELAGIAADFPVFHLQTGTDG